MESLYRQLTAPFAGNKLLLQERCWVCGRPATEDHHLIPQSYGGVNGPQVSLCGNDHTTLHTISYRVALFELPDESSTTSAVRKAIQQLSDVKDATGLIRLWALAFTVYRSRARIAENQEGKKTKFSKTLDWEHSQKLKQLCATFGVSQDTMMDVMIDELHARYIGSIKPTNR